MGEFLFGFLILMGVAGVRDVLGVHASAMCAQFVQANWNNKFAEYLNTGGYNDAKVIEKVDEASYHTIGAWKFRTTHIFLDSGFGVTWDGANSVKPTARIVYLDPSQQSCPYKYNADRYVEMCVPEDQVEIRTLAVKQNGVIMTGWLHFEIELMDKTDEIYGIYIQVRDEWFNAIGEFVNKEEEQCKPTTAGLVTPTPYQVMPCSAVGFREAKVNIFNKIFEDNMQSS